MGQLAEALAAQPNSQSSWGEAEESSDLDEDFSAIEKIGATVLQVGVGKDAVHKEENCCRKDQVVQSPPERPPDARAQKRREEDDEKQIERNGAGKIDERL